MGGKKKQSEKREKSHAQYRRNHLLGMKVKRAWKGNWPKKK